MARLTFPSDRLVYASSSYAGSAFKSAAGSTATVYSDSAGTTLADVQNFDGSANPTATFTVDTTSRLPLFLGPASGADTLYVKVGTGPVTVLYAVTAGDISAAVGTEVTNRTAADAAHVAASDPHGDRAAASSALTAHTSNTSNPHAVTAAQVGAENVVVHGSTAGTARPAGATVVHWIGSVVPSNAATNDEWTDTTNKILKRWNGTSFDSLGSATSGASGKGYSIPKGALDTWKASRNASATTRCEVVGFGDSLIWGQQLTGAAYSWLQRLRERAATDGYTDGGRGLNAQYDQTTDNYTGEPAPIASKTGFAASLPSGMTAIPGSLFSTTGAETVTYNVVGTKARLWWHRYTSGGRFTYKINGGSTVTVNAGATEAAPLPIATGGGFSYETIMLTSADGLTSGTNTIQITNSGGSPVARPTILDVATDGTAGTLNGTYWYVATTVTVSGETLPTAAVSGTRGTAGSLRVDFQKGQGALTVRVYRGTSSGGPFGLVGSTTGNNNANYNFVDTGFTPGAAPPSSDTSGLDSSMSTVAVNVEALKDAGIVWQNHGVQGQSTYDVFNPTDPTNNPAALPALGLQWGTGSNGISVGTGSELLPTTAQSGVDSPLARANARKPALVILAFGTNDFGKEDAGNFTLSAPTAATAGTGVGSGLGAGTYYYKVQRVVNGQFGGGPLSPASSGTTATSGQQIAVTAPTIGAGNAVGGAVFNVFRSTSSGGTYGLVGQIVGSGQTMIDTVATPGAQPALTTQYFPLIDVSYTEAAVGLALQLIRNAGADALVVLPATVPGSGNSRNIAPVFRNAIQRAAEAASAAWVDFDYVLGPISQRVAAGYQTGFNANPHLLKPAYQAQGDFVWDNLLKV